MTRPIPDLPPELWSSMRALAPEADRFVSLVRAHQLLPIAANDPALDPRVLPAVQDAWQHVRARDDARSAAYDAELEELVSWLDPEDYVFIRGAAFRRTIYPDRRLRPMHDIDIVVRKGREPSIVRLLADRGYVAVPGAHRHFIKPPRDLPVEIIPLFTQEARHAIDYDEVFRERTHGPLGGPYLAGHHALATCALLIGTIMNAHARMYLDLWLLSRDSVVVERAVETAVRWKMRRVFHAAMCLLARFLPDSGKPLKETSGRMLTRSERRLVEQIIIPRAVLGAPGWRPLQLARRLALLDSSAIRARFLASLMGG